MGRPAKYSEQVKADALDRLRAGQGTNQVARDIGVPAPTLSGWAKAAGIVVDRARQTRAAADATARAWAEQRKTLIDRLGEVAGELLEKARHVDAREAQAFMTAVAIGVDKAQLLSGSATSRTEVFDVERRRARVAGMADELAARRAARGDEPPAAESG